MKLVFLLLISLVFGLTVNAQSPYVPDEFVFYDTTSGAPFIYDKAINTNRDIYGFNCPIAYDVQVSGNHLRFAITNEDFRWHIMRRTTNNYIDFFIGVLDGQYSYYPPYTPNPSGDVTPRDPIGGVQTNWDYIPYVSNYVIRIEFNR